LRTYTTLQSSTPAISYAANVDDRSMSIVDLSCGALIVREFVTLRWQGFTETQLRYFSTTQAAVITSSQYQSLDAAKQEIIREKLADVQSDLLNDPTEDANTGN